MFELKIKLIICHGYFAALGSFTNSSNWLKSQKNYVPGINTLYQFFSNNDQIINFILIETVVNKSKTSQTSYINKN